MDTSNICTVPKIFANSLDMLLFFGCGGSQRPGHIRSLVIPRENRIEETLSTHFVPSIDTFSIPVGLLRKVYGCAI